MRAKPELTIAQPMDQAHANTNVLYLVSQTTPTILIEPPRNWEALGLKEIWIYRELLYFLTWRDIKVRYKQTAIGAAWAILQPFLTMVVFALIFGNLLRVPSEGVPYPLFAYAALLPWNFFAAALNRSSNSLVYDANLISKVYFPRLIVPLSAILALTVDFAVLTLPLFLLLAFTTALGVGLWLSALNVKYRDIAYAIPFLIQFWLFITPVAYSSSMIPDTWRALYGLNPMAGVIEGFRWALFGTAYMPSGLIVVSIAIVIALLIGGLFYFRRMESQFADVV